MSNSGLFNKDTSRKDLKQCKRQIKYGFYYPQTAKCDEIIGFIDA